ncbi:selenium cofactor biosynthesis protein YqeC [Alkalilimnicola ehrlichii MLHE-1]|uniref:Anaerobic dehydrogenase cluster protein n=1 Tax=Alkalilimnicola ehrlichii (strain ATCC BAA-1101 / DSM 17681 / MLHE-1) TaxID=187272 RepID=Q0A933_ALKEH|nr:selenium cofactor biosynthesis protein YqeC [Alkalilimnicola ehrlichii]ABI56654.1 anaerobic dehydrogenase cluster protein [Alkalilimnicola ehrlichii MLHE-1]
MQVGLIDALAADEGVVCLIGAGGKKTTMARLAWLQRDRAVGLSSTVFCAPLPDWLPHPVLTGDADQLAARAPATARAYPASPVAFYGAPERADRHTGLAPELIDRLHHGLHRRVTLVKADGARMRRIKAPGDNEPLLTPGCQRVIAVLSIKAVGRPLDHRVAHRPERVSEAVDLEPGGIIGPEHLARLLTGRGGLMRGLGGRRVTPLINMVDSDTDRARARRVAERVLENTERFDRVVLASMRREQALVELIRA